MMHCTFSRVPQRSYEAVVGDRPPELEELLFALAVDPHEVADVIEDRAARSIQYQLGDSERPGRPAFGGEGIEDRAARSIRYRLEDFAHTGRLAFVGALETISAWTMSSLRCPGDPLNAIERYDRRLGVWIGCQLAREVVSALPKIMTKPWRAIETAERWVVGKASGTECYETYLQTYSCTSEGAASYAFGSEAGYGAAFFSKSGMQAAKNAIMSAASCAVMVCVAASVYDDKPSKNRWKDLELRSLASIATLSMARFIDAREMDIERRGQVYDYNTPEWMKKEADRRVVAAISKACLSYPVIPDGDVESKRR